MRGGSKESTLRCLVSGCPTASQSGKKFMGMCGLHAKQANQPQCPLRKRRPKRKRSFVGAPAPEEDGRHLHHVPWPSCCFLLQHSMRCGSVRPSLRCCLRARVPPRVQGVRRPALGMHHSLEQHCALIGSQFQPNQKQAGTVPEAPAGRTSAPGGGHRSSR